VNRLYLIVLFLLFGGMLDAKEVLLWDTSVDVEQVKDRNFSKLGDTRVYSEETTIIDGDLNLDIGSDTNRSSVDYYNGMAVSGDLIVNGNIIAKSNDVAFLYVAGNVHAYNIVTTGYRFRVDGNISVAGIMVELDESNTIYANAIKAKVFISEDMYVSTSYNAIEAVEIGSDKSMRSIGELRKKIATLDDKSSDSETVKEIVKRVLEKNATKMLEDIVKVTGAEPTHLDIIKKESTMPDDIVDYLKKYANKIRIGEREINATDVTSEIVAKITMLDISDRSLEEIPKFINKLTSLVTLKADDNSIDRIPEELFTLEYLEELDMTSTNIRVVPKSIKKLKKLKKALFYSCDLIALPKEIGELRELSDLDVSYTWTKYLPDELFEMGKLKNLDLFSSSVGYGDIMQKSFSKLVLLEEINLGRNGLTRLPDDLYNVNWLKELYISDNKHEILDDLHLEKFPVLEKLGMFGLGMTKIPNTISQMSSLKMLYIGNNRLYDIDDFKFPELEVLYAYENYFAKIPDSILSINTLKRLNLSNNDMKRVEVKFARLPNLVYLDLNGNSFEKGVVNLSPLISLETLSMESCDLKKIPDSVFGLVNLKDLDLSDNKIESIPPQIANLQKLEKLDISDNKVTHLYPYIASIKTLKSLDLDDNPIKNLPSSARSMSWGTLKLFVENNDTQISYEVAVENCQKQSAKDCSYIAESFEDDDNDSMNQELLEISCNNGHAYSCYILGYSSDDNITFTTKYNKKACEMGDKDSCITLGKQYSSDDDKVRDNNQSFYYYKKGCDLKSRSACKYIAYDYREASGVDRNYTEAMKIYANAQAKNRAYGYIGKGSMYLYGEGVEKSWSRAFEYYQRACWLKGDKWLCRNIVPVLYVVGGLIITFLVVLFWLIVRRYMMIGKKV